MQTGSGLSLLCRADTRLFALPLQSVVETMRPLPIEAVAGAPDFVLGLAVIRGMAVPVVDSGRMLNGKPSSIARFVLLKVGERRIALAVAAVLGLRALTPARLQELPPLIRGADADVIAAIGALDAELLMVLRAVRIVPEDLPATMRQDALAS